MFKRIFDERHLEYIKKFITKNLPTIVVEKIPFDKQCTKLLILMDAYQLKLLELHFSMDTLKDKDFEDWLASFGFFSKINVFEKNTILSDIVRKKLLKIIQYNHALIDYDNIPENTDTALTYNLLKNLYSFYSTYKAAKSSTAVRNSEYKYKTVKKEKFCLDFYNQKTFLKNMSPEMLPTAPDTKFKFGFSNRTKNMKIYDIEKNETTQTSIDNFVEDAASILRKKKALYAEKSGPINYKSEAVFEIPEFAEELKKFDNPVFDRALYEKFDARMFLNEVVFINNNIPIPMVSKYTSFTQFRKYIKGDSKFFRHFLNERIAYLLMCQDTSISKTDAFFLASEFKRYLTLPQVEYFYKSYINSSQYKPAKDEKEVEITK